MGSSSTRIVTTAMSSPNSPSQRLVREAPKVGDYRRGARLRTTPAGTWFSATGPDEESACLLLIHPGVDTKVLVPTAERLAALDLPGVLPPRPPLIEQAGRNWLVAAGPPAPPLADLLGGTGAYRTPGNAAALLSDVATTLLATHHAGLAHGGLDARSVLVGQDGAALLTDWGTSPTATAPGDMRSWAVLVELLAEAWCTEDELAAAAFASAVRAAGGPAGLAGGIDELRALARTAERATLVETAREQLAPAGPGGVPPAHPRAIVPAAEPLAEEPPTTPAVSTEQPSRAGSRPDAPRWRVMLLAALIVVTLAGAAVDLYLFVTRHTEATALKIQSVSLWAQWDGSTCTLLGVITTNGAPGTVTYGWTGDIPAGPALTARATGEHNQIEVTRVWTGSALPTTDPLVTLQILRPELRQASAHPALACGH